MTSSMKEEEEELQQHVPHRFKKVLQTFLTLEPNDVLNDVYIDLVISHLTGKYDKDYIHLFESDDVLQWIQSYTNKAQTDQKVNKQVYGFYLRLLAIVIDKGVHLEELFNSNVFEQINESIASKPELRTTASVKLGQVRVYKGLLKHKSGISWIKTSDSWKTVFQYCIENQTVYVLRESQQFMSEFAFKVDKELNDTEFCLEILNVVCAPILNIDIQGNEIGVDSLEFNRQMSTSLQLLTNIMLYIIQSRERSCISEYIFNTGIKYKVCWLKETTRNQSFIKDIVQNLVCINFLYFADGLLDDSMPNKSLVHQEFLLRFFNHTKVCIVYDDVRELLHMVSVYYNLWTALGDRAPKEIYIENRKYQFENQLTLILIVPLLVNQHKDEVFLTYMSKLMDGTLHHTIRISYIMRDIINKNVSMLPDITKASVQQILAIKSALKHDRAVYVFKAMFHSLTSVKDLNPHKYADKLLETPTLLSAILNGMHAIMTEYRISWNESIETMSVLNMMLLFLEKPNLTPRLAVEALKLAQLSIEHFLPPNLALLVNNLNGSPIQLLGWVIVKRLHDVNWEIRDSALELVHAVALIAVFKYPPFQEHIFQNNICQEAMNLMKYDSEAFVRASALKSLQPMVGITLLWDKCLVPMDLLGTVLHIIRTETEAIVRIEAVRLLCFIYKHHRIPQHQYDLLFATMAHCATKDLHWEVKTSAIAFQKLVIHRQFTHYGAINGAFPSVTFSKEKRKIVTLTKEEISNRIDKILDDLSVRGSLGILLTGLHDECDLNVVKVSSELCKTIIAIYKKHNAEISTKYFDKNPTPFTSASVQMSTFQINIGQSNLSIHDDFIEPTIDLNNLGFSQQEEDKDPYKESMEVNESDGKDDILESIVLADDISLLADAYNNKLNVNASIEIDMEHYRNLTKIDRVQFIDHLYNFDFDKIVREREEWMDKNESFNSLLEDVLLSLPLSDINNTDCN